MSNRALCCLFVLAAAAAGLLMGLPPRCWPPLLALCVVALAVSYVMDLVE